MADREASSAPEVKAPRPLERPAPDLRASIADAASPARRYLFGLCGSWDRAEELAQEALLKAWARRETFDARSEARTWIFAIVRNHWLDSLRRSQTADRLRKVESMTDQTTAADPSPGPAGKLMRQELSAALERALEGLPPEQREALALRESEGLTFAQVAGVLSVPAATAKSRVRYALLKLSEELEPFRGELP